MVFPTALGWAGVALSDEGVCAVVLPKRSKRALERKLGREGCGSRELRPARRPAGKELQRTVTLLRRFFTGQPVPVDLPLDLRGHTPFQRSVWRAAQAIPCGETRSYAWIAKRIGKPKAARAVGQAMGANPVPILVP
jgi:O6-methylguanine-DNA--protein-cysteine methyltransferase